MNRRVLVVEPDLTIRRMMERALSAAGFAPTSVATIEASRAVLDSKRIEVAIVELRATNTDGAEGIRLLRADYPELPLIVTGTLMTTRVMQELIRTRVDDVVPKPFSPRELATAVDRVLRQARTRGDGGMEYAAAMAVARRAIVEGRLSDAEPPLERARAVSPLDAEAMSMFALVRELDGVDDDASRAYRAALVLRQEQVTEDALPLEGLARMRSYEGARAVPAFDHLVDATLWFVGDPMIELALGPPGGVAADVIVFALALVPSDAGATYARLGANHRGFLIATTPMTERLALRIVRTFDRPKVVAHGGTLARIGAAATPGAANDVAPQA